MADDSGVSHRSRYDFGGSKDARSRDFLQSRLWARIMAELQLEPYHRAMALRTTLRTPFHVARTQVSLPKGSFIRALPFVNGRNTADHCRIDALVICADILAAAYVQLIELALRSKWQESQTEELRAQHLDIGLFQHAWSMVDQIYSVRLLLFKSRVRWR